MQIEIYVYSQEFGTYNVNIERAISTPTTPFYLERLTEVCSLKKKIFVESGMWVLIIALNSMAA